MARLNHMFTRTLRTPVPDASDSDGVLVALETARALEARGDTCEATRWLRRAATEAEQQGNDARVLVFAHAAADLTSTVREMPSAPPATPVRESEPSEPTIRQPDLVQPVESVAPEDTATQVGSDVTTIPDDEAAVPTLVPPPPSPKSPQPASADSGMASMSIVCRLSVSADQPLTERSMRVGATRVAVRKAARNAKSFYVERLDPGQRLPAGAIEALLVFAEGVDASADSEAEDVSGDSTVRPRAKVVRGV